MVKGLYTAYTGMINEQNRMDVLTNNLANVDTNGYKKEGATSQAFDDVLMYKIKDLSEAGRLSKRIGTGNLGVKIGENYTDYSQGSLKITGNNCDFAITGDGFFNIEFTDKQGNTSTSIRETVPSYSIPKAILLPRTVTMCSEQTETESSSIRLRRLEWMLPVTSTRTM